MASAARCRVWGMKGRRTSSKWYLAMTASLNGFGMPFLEVLPSAAKPNTVSMNCSKPNAGLIRQTNLAEPGH